MVEEDRKKRVKKRVEAHNSVKEILGSQIQRIESILHEAGESGYITLKLTMSDEVDGPVKRAIMSARLIGESNTNTSM